MRYMLLFAGDQAAFNAMSPADAQDMYAKIGDWWAHHSSTGALVSGEQLEPPNTAKTVRHEQDDRLVIDGPFMETKEHIGGFAIVEVSSIDEALDLARTWPAGGAVEVRRLIEAH
ncbi:MAG: YciI family protein [Candidatus Dormiibacterota bacterium]